MKFIGISFGVLDRRVLCLAASNGRSLANANGLELGATLEFIASLHQPKSKEIFISFNSAIAWELLFAELPVSTKDILLNPPPPEYEANGPEPYKRLPLPWAQVSLPRINTDLTDKKKNSDQFDPCRSVAKHWTLLHRANRTFRIKGCLTIHDICSFYGDTTLPETAQKFLGITPPSIEKNLLDLWRQNLLTELKARCIQEAKIIAQLARRVSKIIDPLFTKPLRSWHGPSAIATALLTKWGARGQAKRLHNKNTAYLPLRAVDCALFGSRVEQLMLGTVPDVTTLDLNSAYAAGIMRLGRLPVEGKGSSGGLIGSRYHPLRYTRKYDPTAPMSVWFIRYELPAELHFGVLPHRLPQGSICYGRRGAGWYWQPEAAYILQRFGEYAEVVEGCAVPEYEPVSFASEIEALYNYRLQLKAASDPGELIIKLTLCNLYGKFAQHQGNAYHQCRAWAGWITSYVRRVLLEATERWTPGKIQPNNVIAFCQDAVHTSGDPKLNVPLGENIGEWKRAQYEQGLYLGPGLYELGAAEKVAQRGSQEIDFQKLAGQLSRGETAKLERAFFCGWQMASQNPIKWSRNYLQSVTEQFTLNPEKSRARKYQPLFDWLRKWKSSEMRTFWTGESQRYQPHQEGFWLKLQEHGWH